IIATSPCGPDWTVPNFRNKVLGFGIPPVTDPSEETRGGYSLAVLECILSIIRALRMGSCLSAESRSPVPGSPSSPTLGIRKRKNSKKRPGSWNTTFDYRREEPLHRIPGRLFLNGSSDVASLFTQQGRKGTNQDAMLVWENFGSRTDTVFCGVFDGHGPFGHMVARRVRDSLPLKLSAHWEVNITSEDVLREISLNTGGSLTSEDTTYISADDESRASIDVEQTEKQPQIFHTLKESFLKAFKVMDRELRVHANIDCFCSGTTAVTLIKQGPYIVIGNVGDSRAVLGTRDKDDSLVALQLTVDLKPNLPGEAERIRKCRGRVFALQDEPEVSRVWLPNNDSPGLAMARAFGDFCLKDFGLISVPEISCRRLTEKDEFIVLATDGIWDVLSNKEVVDIIASATTRSSAARALVESAVRSWRYKYPTSKVDDCAVVCLFLNSSAHDISTCSNTQLQEQHASVGQVDICGDKGDDLSGPTYLDRSGTVRTGKDAVPDTSDEENSKQEDINSGSGIDWSALEGVSRVNTLLNLPRFVPGKDDKKAAREPRAYK
ncbi:PP2C domain-containing protein, partial [Cephalotus follicularis]